MRVFGPEVPQETSWDISLRPLLRQTPFGEEMRARAGQMLEWTTIKQAYNEMRVEYKEEGIPGLMGRAMGMQTPYLVGTEREEPRKLTKAEWEDSEWFREDIPWQAEMTEGRAEVMAELHDERVERQRILAGSPGGFGRGAAGLAVGLAVTALDPINYIPIFGPAMRARAIGKYGMVAGRMLLGAGEATIATAATEPWLIKKLQEQGDHVGWTDAVLDVALAGPIGALFGGVSGVMARRKAGRAMRKAVADHLEDKAVNVGPIFDGEPLFLREARETPRSAVAAPTPEAEPRPSGLDETTEGYVRGYLKEVQTGEPGGRIFDYDVAGQGGTAEIRGYGSTYPPFMRDKGWTKKEVYEVELDAHRERLKNEGIDERRLREIEEAHLTEGRESLEEKVAREEGASPQERENLRTDLETFLQETEHLVPLEERPVDFTPEAEPRPPEPLTDADLPTFEDIPEAEVIDRMAAEDKLIREAVEDPDGNLIEYDEPKMWDEAKNDYANAQREAEAWEVAADCLIQLGI